MSAILDDLSFIFDATFTAMAWYIAKFGMDKIDAKPLFFYYL